MAILLGERQEVKSLLLDGEVILNPDKEILLLVWRAYPLEGLGNRPGPDELALAEAVFRGRSLEELEELTDRIVAPTIRGRSRAKLLAALTAVSPMWLRGSEGGRIPGCMRVLFFGDVRTGKGLILRWFWEHGLAGHAVGETASRTGLIYNIDGERRILSWGVLPLNDGGMAVIEGLHGLSNEEISRFREALAQMRVEVHRAVSGAAWCRTRILADLNLRNPLKGYLHPVQGLIDSFPFSDPADLSRWDLALPFFADDVPVSEMYGRIPPYKEEEGEAFRILVKFAWSLRSDDIIIEPEAFKLAVEKLEELKTNYEVVEIPIIHNGTLWSILRIAASLAILEVNISEDGKVRVERRQVEEAYKIIVETLDKLELGEYKQIIGEEKLDDSEYKKIKERIEKDEDLKRILNELISRPMDSDELAGRLGCSSPTVRRRAAELKEAGIVKRTGKGYTLTPKGIFFLKMDRKIGSRDQSDHFDHLSAGGSDSTSMPPPGKGDQNDQIDHEGQDFHPSLEANQPPREGACELCGYSGFTTFQRVRCYGRIITICQECFKKRREWTPA
jgi:DNA replicative helicase MCM subunit Mcm2 (Cdc46/Mcm family)